MKGVALKYVNVNNSEVEQLMITFHLAPTTEVFNYVILSDGEMYQEDEPDRVDEFYVEYADEDWSARKRRIQALRKKLDERKGKPVGTHRAKYSNPLKLAWVCAAVKAFPWLVDECARPLYIERAYKYTDSSLFNLTQQVSTHQIIDQRPETTVYKLSNTSRASDLYEQYKALAKINLMRFGASGDSWYVNNTRELFHTSLHGEYIFHMAVGNYRMDIYYDIYNIYTGSEKIKLTVGAVDRAIELIQRARGNFNMHEIDPADLAEDDDIDALLNAL